MELNINSILFVADFNSDVGYALDHALSLAQKYQATIRIIYCFDIMNFNTQSTAELYLSEGALKDSIEDSLLEEESHIHGQLQGICHKRLVELRADKALIAGIDIERKPAMQSILDAASACQADLIIMCAQHQSGARNDRLNSTAMKVLQKATVPVFVVKGGKVQAG